jgi:hypothetical protein
MMMEKPLLFAFRACLAPGHFVNQDFLTLTRK